MRFWSVPAAAARGAPRQDKTIVPRMPASVGLADTAGTGQGIRMHREETEEGKRPTKTVELRVKGRQTADAIVPPLPPLCPLLVGGGCCS